MFFFHFLATERNNSVIVQELLNAGVKPSIKNNANETALQFGNSLIL